MSTIDDFIARLESFLSQQAGAPVTVHNPTPLAGGASRDSWVFEARIGDQREKLVLRKDYPTQMNEDALTRAQEFHLMRRAYESGVMVARMRYLCPDDSVLGHPFFIMDYVEGISIGRKVITLPELATARDALPEQLAEQLARIHRMPVDDLDFLRRPADGDPIRAAIAETYALLDALKVANPALEYALRWAQSHAPTCDRVTFVHGDFRIGNLLVGAHGLTAVIDWEFAHIGDPREELGYFCMRDWRFGNGTLRAGGLCDRERFISAYERASGIAIDRRAVEWWELMGNIRWAIMCLSQAQRHLSGKDPSVELASLGRRSAEMQLEALALIEGMSEQRG